MLLTFIGTYLLVVNFLAFFLYGLDKYKSKKHRWRIPESTLLWIAVLGGSIGALGAMQLFRHKTRHKKFNIGIPLILVCQLAAVVGWWYSL